MECPVCKKRIKNHKHILDGDTYHQAYLNKIITYSIYLVFSKNSPKEIEKRVHVSLRKYIDEYIKVSLRKQIDQNKRSKMSLSKTKIDGKKNRSLRKQEGYSNGVEGIDYVYCRICEKYKSSNILKHLISLHDISGIEYRKLYGVSFYSEKYILKLSSHMKTNNPNNNPSSIKKMKETKKSTRNDRVKKSKEKFAQGLINIPNNSGRGIGGIRKDIGEGEYFRSMWEANLARIFNFFGIKYEYEKKFVFYDEKGQVVCNYIVDFYLPKYDKYVEVKGVMDTTSFQKINIFKKEVKKKIYIIDSTKYLKIMKKYSKFLNHYERSGFNIKTHPSSFLF